MFKFLKDFIRETRTRSTSKKGRFILNGGLIFDILIENNLVDDLLVSGLTEELVKDAGKILWGENLKSMSLISKIVRPYVILSKDDICGIRIMVYNFPIFTNINPLEVLEYYLESCLKDGIDPLVDPFNLLETYPGVRGKRKKESCEEGPSRPQNKKKKVVTFLDEDEVSLSKRQKAILLKDTSVVVQEYSKASDTPTPGKLPKARELFILIMLILKGSYQLIHLPFLKPVSSISQPISEPIPLPPPTETHVLEPVLKAVLEPVTKTPTFSETQLQQQQQQIPQTPPPSQFYLHHSFHLHIQLFLLPTLKIQI